MAGEWDMIKGMWKQIKGDARAEWGKLTDDDWDQIAGNRDKLIGRLQEEYGWQKNEAERKVDSWFSRYSQGNRERSIES
jgi:uncharacterized protein YjbJ (UPF0337 family)